MAVTFRPGFLGADRIDRVEVDWPSGRIQALTKGIEENQTLRIAEPK
jgi:hypothetical protein